MYCIMHERMIQCECSKIVKERVSMFRYLHPIKVYKMRKAQTAAQFDALTNEGMIDLMHHQYTRFVSVHPLQINMTALWQKWIRR